MGTVGEFSVTGLTAGVPYTAAVLEKRKCRMRALMMTSLVVAGFSMTLALNLRKRRGMGEFRMSDAVGELRAHVEGGP